MNIRNIAIIAHVDHGKTTLVDQLLKSSGTFRDNEEVNERAMDSNDIERERGITILAKTTSIIYKDTKINILDTPGHADFGGEVERIMNMVDGCLLLVDAFEGTMPQTRFVLKKALQAHIKPIVVINKVDRNNIDIERTLDEVLELFIELGAPDEFLEFPVIYTSGLKGTSSLEANVSTQKPGMEPVLDTIIKEIPAPKADVNAPLQLQVALLRVIVADGKISEKEVEYLNRNFAFDYTVESLAEVYDNCRAAIGESFDEKFKNGVECMKSINAKLAGLYTELLGTICDILIASDGEISLDEIQEAQRIKALLVPGL